MSHTTREIVRVFDDGRELVITLVKKHWRFELYEADGCTRLWSATCCKYDKRAEREYQRWEREYAN